MYDEGLINLTISLAMFNIIDIGVILWLRKQL